jgi:hypothetical protein
MDGFFKNKIKWNLSKINIVKINLKININICVKILHLYLILRKITPKMYLLRQSLIFIFGLMNNYNLISMYGKVTNI